MDAGPIDEGAEEGEEAIMVPSEPESDAERLWRMAQALNRAAGPVSRALPPMLFFTDPERTPRPWETAARLPAGAGVVFRAFGRADALETGRRLRDATQGAGVRLLIGLDVALAEALEADGLHLPERALGEAEVVRAAHPGWLLTGAVHSGDTAQAAPEALDAVVLSPIFPAGGASGAKPPLGMETLTTVGARRPTYALGGVDAETAAALAGSNACGFAAIGAIEAAFNPPPLGEGA